MSLFKNGETNRSSYLQIVFEIPFNSKRKWHLQIAAIQPGANETTLPQGHQKYQLMMKGAPEILIKKCTKIATAGGEVPLDEKMMAKFQVKEMD